MEPRPGLVTSDGRRDRLREVGGQMTVPLEVEYYPASPGEIAQAAGQTANQVAAIEELRTSFLRQHRGVVAAVEGDIEGSVLGLAEFPAQTMTSVRQSGVWAIGCLVEFAEAVRSFNTSHASPRCVKDLLRAYEQASADNFGVPPESDPDESTELERSDNVDPYRQKLAAARDEVVRELNAEYHRLEGWLDGEADRVSRMLTRGPNATDVRRMWSAGMLPPYTPLIFPGLDLPGEDLARLQFGDPSWSLADNIAINPSGDGPCTAYGWIRGPDGEWYPIAVPSHAEHDCDSPYGCLANPNYEGSGVPYEGGWVTIHSRTGEFALGDAPGLDDTLAFALAGVQPYGPQSMGDDQSLYLVMDPETGAVDLRDGTEPQSTPYGPESGGIDYPYHPSQQAAVDRAERYGGALDLGIRIAEAGNSTQIVENGRHYAYQVVFQQDEDGYRRAVVLLNQAQYDQEGDPQVRQHLGRVNADGELEPAIDHD